MNNSLPEQSATGFWSIERFVAFVLGPAVTAGSGWLSTILAKDLGIHLAGAEIAGIFGTGALAAAALAYKWLHGRQVETQVEAVVAKSGSIPGVGDLIHTTLADLEGLAESAAHNAIERISGAKSPPHLGQAAAEAAVDYGARSDK